MFIRKLKSHNGNIQVQVVKKPPNRIPAPKIDALAAVYWYAMAFFLLHY